MTENNKNTVNESFPGQKVTRGDATMTYGLSTGSYTIRFHLKLDQPRFIRQEFSCSVILSLHIINNEFSRAR